MLTRLKTFFTYLKLFSLYFMFDKNRNYKDLWFKIWNNYIKMIFQLNVTV